MLLDTQTIIVFIIGQLFVAVGIWSGIKADIKNIHNEIAEAKKRADDAHSRIDNVLERFPDSKNHYGQ